MTIVVAGYKQSDFYWDTPANYIPDRKSGVFMVADSIISNVTATGRKPLVSEFRKIVEVPIHVWEPHFIGQHFEGYLRIFNTFNCLVAFAGSTLTAQHIVNNISGHLGRLRIDYERGEDFKYVVKKNCDENNLIKNGNSSVYNDELFVPERDYNNLVSARFISDVVEHSINKALESKMKHVIDAESLNAMRTELLLGITCPIDNEAHLYKYEFMTRDLPEGGVEAYCSKTLVPANDIGVIGMKNTYGAQARMIAQNAFNTGTTFQDDITDFVVSAVRNDTTWEIGFPVVIKTIDRNEVKFKSIKE
ncbi:hypothetical protein [Vibrio parahaemolyticus]|uniref:hypothetical protein n=1 Tax=Vibrio parahaemolyticus TaxID=670 RepID=UPI0023624FE7|nr:hypothetical protein [Vibrio parahaemolyticus]MDG3397598.1 hypothetical protein [Vibrio parahaemolyticus]